jgi:hypothetical protein
MKMQKLGVQFLVGMTILCSYATESTVRLQLTHIDAAADSPVTTCCTTWFGAARPAPPGYYPATR